MANGEKNWLEVSDAEANAWRKDPALKVATPAIALGAVGVLGLVANLLVGLVLMMAPGADNIERPAGMSDEQFENFRSGARAAPLFNCCCVSLPALLAYPIVILAAIQMHGLKMHWLAVTGAIIGMAPCSPVMLLGLPIGIWCLVVLYDSSVRAGFDRAAQPAQ